MPRIVLCTISHMYAQIVLSHGKQIHSSKSTSTAVEVSPKIIPLESWCCLKGLWVFVECVCVRVCMCMFDSTAAPKGRGTPIVITAEESEGTASFHRLCPALPDTHQHTLHKPVSLSPSSPLVSLSRSVCQAMSCHSLSTSHSLIFNYWAGSCRSETITHQTWLPVPMEPVGQQMKLEELNAVTAWAHVA